LQFLFSDAAAAPPPGGLVTTQGDLPQLPYPANEVVFGIGSRALGRAVQVDSITTRVESAHSVLDTIIS
jgi:hypothetical protein